MRSAFILSCLISILAPLLPGGGSAFAQCDQCPKRQVTLYDFEVTVPRPDSLVDVVNWYSLYFAGPGAAAAIFNPQCLRFIDAAFYRDTTGVPAKSLTVGIDHPHTAPSGAMKGMDYLLTGTVSQDGSGYKLDMSLQTSCGRKTVVSASGHFDRADQASTLAADLAKQKFIPLDAIIRDFEKKERGENTEVSIGGYSSKLVVEPKKLTGVPGEKIPVTLTLTDCDGEPLAGRKISLTGKDAQMAPPSVNGSFTAAEATTSSNGSVTVDFVLGSATATALARAYFFHQTPFGCDAVAMDETPIAVKSAAQYRFKFTYAEKRTQDSKTEEKPLPTWIKTSRKSETRSLFIAGSGVLNNSAYAAGAGTIELDGRPLEGGVTTGSYEEAIHSFSNENYADEVATIRSGGFEDRITNGKPWRSDSSLPTYYLSFDPAGPRNASQFTFNVPFHLQGLLFGQGFQVTTGSGKTFDTSYTSSSNDSSETTFSTLANMTFAYQDSVVVVRVDKDTTWSSEGIETNLVTHLNAYFSPITVPLKPNAIHTPMAQERPGSGRIRALENGGLIHCRLDGIRPEERVRVEVFSTSGNRITVLHDAPRGQDGDLNLSTKGLSGSGLAIVVFRAGSLDEIRILYRHP